MIDGVPMQVIVPEAGTKFERVDLRSIAEADFPAEAKRLATGRPGMGRRPATSGDRTMRLSIGLSLFAALVMATGRAHGRAPGNLLQDPSFEMTKDKDRFGLVFARWGGWNVRGRLRVPGRPGRAHAAGTRACCSAGRAPRSALAQNVELDPGRYRITAYLRGLDIGTGTYGMTTEFMFDGKYHPAPQERHVRLDQLTYVGEIKEKKQAGPSFGLDGSRLFLDRRRVAGEGRPTTSR